MSMLAEPLTDLDAIAPPIYRPEKHGLVHGAYIDATKDGTYAEVYAECLIREEQQMAPLTSILKSHPPNSARKCNAGEHTPATAKCKKDGKNTREPNAILSWERITYA